MDMSWQTAFAFACAAVFAAIVPGTLGYATARVEMADRQIHELVRLRAELHAAHKAFQQASAPCDLETGSSGSGDSPATDPSDDHAVPASPDSHGNDGPG